MVDFNALLGVAVIFAYLGPLFLFLAIAPPVANSQIRSVFTLVGILASFFCYVFGRVLTRMYRAHHAGLARHRRTMREIKHWEKRSEQRTRRNLLRSGRL